MINWNTKLELVVMLSSWNFNQPRVPCIETRKIIRCKQTWEQRESINPSWLLLRGSRFTVDVSRLHQPLSNWCWREDNWTFPSKLDSFVIMMIRFVIGQRRRLRTLVNALFEMNSCLLSMIAFHLYLIFLSRSHAVIRRNNAANFPRVSTSKCTHKHHSNSVSTTWLSRGFLWN